VAARGRTWQNMAQSEKAAVEKKLEHMPYRYYDQLKEHGEAVLALAEKLNEQAAKPLTREEKELVRLAVLPLAHDLLSDVAYEFAVGANVEGDADCPLQRFLQLARDLRASL